MSLLANLLVKLSADSAEFQSNLEKAKQKTTSFEESARQSMGNIAKAAAAMGAAATAAAAVIVKKNLESIDSLAKTADKLGIATEALGGLRHAANLSGVAQEKLDMSLQRMTRRLSEAARGSGEAQGAIKELGLDAQRLASMAPEQAFTEIAGAMSKVGSQSDKVRLAFKFFDSEGVALVNTMNMGADGIRAAVKEAEQLGFALSRIDAAKVEAANDAMARSRGALQGMGQTLTVAVAPYIEAVANSLVKAAKQSGGFKEEITSALKSAIMGAARLADVWRGLELIFAGLKVVFAGLTMFVLQGLEQWDHAITDVINAAADAINVLIRGINMLPGIELPELGHAQYSQSLESFARISEEYFAEVDAKFQELGTKPLPSENVRAWLTEIEDAAQIAAEKVAAAAIGRTGEEGEEDPAIAAQRERLAQQLLTLEESLMTEEERLQESHLRRTEIVVNAIDNSLINQVKGHALLEKLATEHEKNLTKIKNKGDLERERFSKMSWARQAEFVTGKMAGMTQAAANENRAMFAIHKAAAIANATISTAQGAAEALKWGWPLGPIFAGLMVAAGVAQIHAIAATSYGGSKGGISSGSVSRPATTVAPSISATGADSLTATVPAPSSAQEQNESEPSQVVNFHVYGNVFDLNETARTLYPALKKAENDGFSR